MKVISLKVPKTLDEKIARLASSRRSSRSEVVREAIAAYEVAAETSFAEKASRFCGILKGPPDLSTNPKHLKGYGR